MTQVCQLVAVLWLRLPRPDASGTDSSVRGVPQALVARRRWTLAGVLDRWWPEEGVLFYCPDCAERDFV